MPNNVYVIDEYNNSQVINNNKNTEQENNQNEHNYYNNNDKLEYQRQPEGIETNEIEISEEDIFSYSRQEDVLFPNYSQSYIVDSDSNEIESRHNISKNTDLDQIDNKSFFEKNPEKVFRDIITKLSETRFNLFLENEFLKNQIINNNNVSNDTTQQFNLTNTNNFNVKDSISRLNSNLTSQNFPGRVSYDGKPKSAKIDELVNELNNLVDMFEKSKNRFNSSHVKTNPT